jgi:hypothetical protein
MTYGQRVNARLLKNSLRFPNPEYIILTMIHLQRFICDLILDTLQGFESLNIFKSKPIPSLIAYNVYWCTNSEWLDRLIAYKQLEFWTYKK